jgi:hypothetical protein
MVAPKSPPETADLLASFHTGYLKEIQHQLVATRSELRSGQDRIHTSIDRLLVLTGQVLEATRMGTPAPPQSGPQMLRQIKEVLSFLGALYKAWPIIRWAIALNTFGWLAKQGARLLGWL